jgi:hypothetical protein
VSTVPLCPNCNEQMQFVGRAQCSGEAGVQGIDHFFCPDCKQKDCILLTGRETACPPTGDVRYEADEPRFSNTDYYWGPTRAA